ncbi:MAG: hypothetical protein DRI75_00995 [Bacteroidetes bacterium]|nr:MAG: hypothetical protein DRI75_00995 [Bacteroidota bacterium]
MKTTLVLFIATLFYSTSLFAQYEVTIEAFVLDKVTNQPIPYVNIGFIEKSIGTVSDETEKFKLTYHEDIVGGKEFLQFSALGYKTLKVRASQLVKFLTNTNKFYLEPSLELLDEVLISNEKRSQIRLGNTSVSSSVMGYWKDKEALGGEITTKIKIKNKKTKLLDIKFNIIENTSDSIKIRVNVYDYKKSYPKKNILKTNIFHIITRKEGEEAIDLRPYNIMVNDDVVFGIELVEVYGENVNFAVSASNNRGTSFLRLISQAKWKRFANVGMNFSVLTSFPVEKDREVIIEREKPKKITLFYDVSKQMKNRVSEKEFELLSGYLKVLKKVDIEVIKFSNINKQAKLFNVLNGKSKELIEYLKNSFYDGATDYKNILKSNTFNADVVMLFTNGISNFSPLEPGINVPTFCINSLEKANHYLLQKTAFYADGHYINLNKVSSKLALDFIINEVYDIETYNDINDKELKQINLLQGKIFHAAGPIQGATIRLKNTFVESQSDSEGYFSIKAKEDDILIVNYLGMIEKEVLVTNPEDIYILLKSDGELLDEVVLTGESKKDEDIEGGFGKRDKDGIGYSLNTITSKDIKQNHHTLADVIRGQFAGVQVTGLDPNNPKFVIRGGGSINNPALAILDIDGSIYTENPPFVDPQEIESITILKSLAATNKYGTQGRGGVIKILTKYTSGNQDQNIIDTALIKGNDYTENDIQLLNYNINNSPYILELEKSITFEEAQNIYYKQQNQDSLLSISYYLDVSNYFTKWNEDFAFTILTNIASVANDNPKALKSLAYKLEELNKYEEAKYIYEQLLVLRPNHEQSYRDLALIYSKTGGYQKAMNLYKKMLSNTIEGLDFDGLLQVVSNELKHLITFHRSKVTFRDLPTDFLSVDFKYDLRIVFEWNDPNTEFEIQFVNPQKKYYKWSHTRFENKERMIDEINYGYHTEEYIIDDADAGEWIINIECLSNKDILNPTYLKYTVYKNYGLANETKEVKVIKLYEQKQKVTLDKFFYK